MHVRWNTTSECVTVVYRFVMFPGFINVCNLYYVCMSCMLLQADVKIQTG